MRWKKRKGKGQASDLFWCAVVPHREENRETRSARASGLAGVCVCNACYIRNGVLRRQSHDKSTFCWIESNVRYTCCVLFLAECHAVSPSLDAWMQSGGMGPLQHISGTAGKEAGTKETPLRIPGGSQRQKYNFFFELKKKQRLQKTTYNVLLCDPNDRIEHVRKSKRSHRPRSCCRDRCLKT